MRSSDDEAPSAVHVILRGGRTLGCGRPGGTTARCFTHRRPRKHRVAAAFPKRCSVSPRCDGRSSRPRWGHVGFRHGSRSARLLDGLRQGRLHRRASTRDLAAARVAARVRAPDGSLAAVPFHRPHPIGHGLDAVLAELEHRDATLAVVRIGEHGRAAGITVGSVATHLLHEARCSVLVVPDAELASAWPTSIALGLDGSVESAAAAAAAWDLSQRLGARVHAIAATGRPGHADLDLVRRIAPDFEEHPTRPATALAEASADADLVVVGSRGLRGIHALGSVSERVAHEARCPVLVVRARGVER